MINKPCQSFIDFNFCLDVNLIKKNLAEKFQEFFIHPIFCMENYLLFFLISFQSLTRFFPFTQFQKYICLFHFFFIATKNSVILRQKIKKNKIRNSILKVNYV